MLEASQLYYSCTFPAVFCGLWHCLLDFFCVLCQVVEVEALVNSRNEACGALLSAVHDFLQEVDKLPIGERLDKLKVCRKGRYK